MTYCISQEGQTGGPSDDLLYQPGGPDQRYGWRPGGSLSAIMSGHKLQQPGRPATPAQINTVPAAAATRCFCRVRPARPAARLTVLRGLSRPSWED